MGVLQARAGGRADVLEEHAVNESRVAFEVDQPVAIDPEDFADVVFGKLGHADLVLRALDDDLMRADAGHLVVDPLAALVELAFDLEGGEPVGDDPDAASRGRWDACPDRDRRGSRAGVLSSCPSQKGQRPGSLPVDLGFALEVVGPLRPLVRDDHPAADDRVFPQLGHARPPQTDQIRSAGPRVRPESVAPSMFAIVQTCHMIRSKSAPGTVNSKIPSRGRGRGWRRPRASRRRSVSRRPP